LSGGWRRTTALLALLAGGHAQAAPLAAESYEAVKQSGLDNLEAERFDEALRYLTEAASRPEAAGDLDLLFLTAHLYRDACRIDEMRSLLPRAQNAAELAERGDLAADAQALADEASSAYQAVEVRVVPAFEDWDDHGASPPQLALAVARAPGNPALTACVPRVAARWNAQLAGLAKARTPLAELPADAWRLTAELPVAGYALSWPGCRRGGAEAGDSPEDACPTATLDLQEGAAAPARLSFPLRPALPAAERPLIRAHHWPWLIGGAAVVLAGGLVATCFATQAIGACQ
jgi:hypothetical protein